MKSDAPPEKPSGLRRSRVLVVDDHLAMAEMVAESLSERGYDGCATDSSSKAAQLLELEDFTALITDLRMPEVDGLGLLELSKRAAPERPVIVMTAYGAVDSAVESIRRGAYHYVTKPFKMAELGLFLERALEESRVRREAAALRRAFSERFSRAGIVAASGAMSEVLDVAERFADAVAPVLLLGETGTGKGLVARAIHAAGRRSGGPFVTVNCAALPETFLESELFGHAQGAFAGATSPRQGLFEEADRGTLFLDEVGELSGALQMKLLDVLERRVVRALGSSRERAVDARIIAATHRNLRTRVAEGSFREDLLYRLEVLTVEIPPLRHRTEDIPALAEHFLRKSHSNNPSSRVERIAKEAMDRLLSHPWPGNVRELEHVIERVVLLARSAEVTPADLPATVGAGAGASTEFSGRVLPLREVQRRYVAWAYGQLGNRKLLTAGTLGIDDKTLARWLARDPELPE